MTRDRPGPTRLAPRLLAGVTACAASAALLGLAGCGHAAAGRAPVGAAGSGGDIEVTGAYVGDDGSSSYLPMYLTLHDTSGQPDLLEAVIAPDATSATWAVAHKAHTPAEIAAFAEPCGADPVLLAQSNAAMAASGDVVVPADGSLELSPGVARLQLNGLARGVRSVPVTLYFASGAEVHLVVPADGPRQDDPLDG